MKLLTAVRIAVWAMLVPILLAPIQYVGFVLVAQAGLVGLAIYLRLRERRALSK